MTSIDLGALHAGAAWPRVDGNQRPIVPGACFVSSLTVLVPDKDHVKEESRKGINYHPVTSRQVNYSPTLIAGQWLYIAGKTAGDMQTVHGAPAGLPHHFSDIEVQTRQVMEFLTGKSRPTAPTGTIAIMCESGSPIRIAIIAASSGLERIFPNPAKAPALALCAGDRDHVPGAPDRDRSDLRLARIGINPRRSGTATMGTTTRPPHDCDH